MANEWTSSDDPDRASALALFGAVVALLWTLTMRFLPLWRHGADANELRRLTGAMRGLAAVAWDCLRHGDASDAVMERLAVHALAARDALRAITAPARRAGAWRRRMGRRGSKPMRGRPRAVPAPTWRFPSARPGPRPRDGPRALPRRAPRSRPVAQAPRARFAVPHQHSEGRGTRAHTSTSASR